MIKTMNVQIKKLYFDSVLPTRGSAQAAGYDLYAHSFTDVEGDGFVEEMIVCPHESRKIGTGVAMAIPDGYVGLVFARSGLASKQGCRPANCVGVIDSDYRGELIVALHNDSEHTQTVCHGERIAQIVVVPYISMDFEEVYELSSTERGDGGFGHTGRMAN